VRTVRRGIIGFATEFPEDRKLRFGFAVATLTIVLGSLVVTQLLRGAPLSIAIGDLPFALRLIAYLVFILFVWSGLQVFDGLIPDAVHRNFNLWRKVIWVCVLLVWPIGPVLYYVLVFLSENSGGAERVPVDKREGSVKL
jgi:hypothetical protein